MMTTTMLAYLHSITTMDYQVTTMSSPSTLKVTAVPITTTTLSAITTLSETTITSPTITTTKTTTITTITTITTTLV